LDVETGFYYYGARYLDPKTSRWISADPAMYEGDYIPSAPINDEARRRNGNLPGMGGIYNTVNMHVYHYAGNNPVKLVDPDGRESILSFDTELKRKITEARNRMAYEKRNAIINNTMRALIRLMGTSYGVPRDNVPTLRNANSLDSKETIKIGNNLLAAVGASLPTGGLAPENYNDSYYGRSGARKDAMAALGLLGAIAGRVRNSDGYFAGDIILEVYKTDGKVTNWVIKEAFTRADGSHGYSEWKQDEALKFIESNKDRLYDAGLLDKINKALDL